MDPHGVVGRPDLQSFHSHFCVMINEPQTAIPSHVFAIHKTKPAPFSTTPDGHVYLQAVHSFSFLCIRYHHRRCSDEASGAIVHIHLPDTVHYPMISKYLYQICTKNFQDYLLPRIPTSLEDLDIRSHREGNPSKRSCRHRSEQVTQSALVR
ncbi:hypothetical protein K474DRAFT_175695 [Panus rudis PR-1116 ss-1]|nr:hypothetical protein K474DRAFT_175695 [Panus rudis PR-1116 ss-1]